MAAVTRYLKRIAPPAGCVLALAVGGCTVGGGSSGRESPSVVRGGTIRGAGATLPAPLYRTWAQAFRRRAGTDVRYEAIGFSRGVSDFTAALVEFGSTDAPLGDVEVATAASDKSRPVHVPVAFGAVAVAYRLPDGRGGLRLDAPTLAAIFLGRVSRWDAPPIRRLNPGRALPAIPIAVVHRADSAGTTRLLTSYLSGGSPEWSRRLGADEAVAWPVGRAVAGNRALAQAVAGTVGGLGYVDAGAARPAGVSRAALRNRAGRFVSPDAGSITAATRDLPPAPGDRRFVAVGASADPAAYPIASPVFALVFEDPCQAKIQVENVRRLRRWLRFVLGSAGQRVAAVTPGFAPLPPDLAARSRAAVRRLVCDGRRL